MSISLNRRAAELLELAARSHGRAADFLELGDTKGCADYASEGAERASTALEISRDASEATEQMLLQEASVGAFALAVEAR